jgi:hypothetical protein
MTFRRKVPVVLVLSGAALVVGFYAVLALDPDLGCFWRTMSDAHVTSNGRSVPDARVLRRPNGTLLVDLGSGGWYRYGSDGNTVWLCNRPRTVTIPGYTYVRGFDEASFPCVAMGTLKAEVAADVEVGPATLSFTSIDADRIKVAW